MGMVASLNECTQAYKLVNATELPTNARAMDESRSKMTYVVYSADSGM